MFDERILFMRILVRSGICAVGAVSYIVQIDGIVTKNGLILRTK